MLTVWRRRAVGEGSALCIFGNSGGMITSEDGSGADERIPQLRTRHAEMWW